MKVVSSTQTMRYWSVMNNLALIVTILVSVAGEDMAEKVFGEVLLKSLNPALREKLEEIHKSDAVRGKSESQTAKIVKSRLSTDEIKELEAAYKKLILPMLQSTMKDPNLDDNCEEVEVDDFKTPSEELAERKIKAKKGKKKDSPRSVPDSVKEVGGKNMGTEKVNSNLDEAKVKIGGVKKENDKGQINEEL